MSHATLLAYRSSRRIADLIPRLQGGEAKGHLCAPFGDLRVGQGSRRSCRTPDTGPLSVVVETAGRHLGLQPPFEIPVVDAPEPTTRRASKAPQRHRRSVARSAPVRRSPGRCHRPARSSARRCSVSVHTDDDAPTRPPLPLRGLPMQRHRGRDQAPRQREPPPPLPARPASGPARGRAGRAPCRRPRQRSGRRRCAPPPLCAARVPSGHVKRPDLPIPFRRFVARVRTDPSPAQLLEASHPSRRLIAPRADRVEVEAHAFSHSAGLPGRSSSGATPPPDRLFRVGRAHRQSRPHRSAESTKTAGDEPIETLGVGGDPKVSDGITPNMEGGAEESTGRREEVR